MSITFELVEQSPKSAVRCRLLVTKRGLELQADGETIVLISRTDGEIWHRDYDEDPERRILRQSCQYLDPEKLGFYQGLD